MRKIAVAVIACFCILSIVNLSFAGSGARMRQAMESMGGREVRGEVTAVDAKEKVVTVKGMRGPITAVCDEKTFVKIGNTIKSCADIQVGYRANMLFESEEGRNVAKSIFLSVPVTPTTEGKASQAPKTESKE